MVSDSDWWFGRDQHIDRQVAAVSQQADVNQTSLQYLLTVMSIYIIQKITHHDHIKPFEAKLELCVRQV
jgi:hypothetical protein